MMVTQICKFQRSLCLVCGRSSDRGPEARAGECVGSAVERECQQQKLLEDQSDGVRVTESEDDFQASSIADKVKTESSAGR
jgi:hypothetical protein